MNTVTSWLWLGTIGMAAGSFIIALIGTTLRKEDRHHAALAVIITAIAATAYYAMANNIGDLSIAGNTFQSARYIDWLVTTPLLLMSLVLVGLPRKAKNRGWILMSLIFADVYMIVTGFIASIVSTDTKWMWYTLSSAALVVIAYFLYGSILSEVRKTADAKVSRLYTGLALYLSALWLAYPILWLLGTTGQGKIDFKTENAIYAILDLAAKVVFGLLLVYNIKVLSVDAKIKEGESTIEALNK